MSSIENKRDFVIRCIYYSIIAIIVYFSLKYVIPIVMPFIIGLCISLALRPMILKITSKFKIKQKWVSMFVLLAFYLTIGVLICFLSFRLLIAIQQLFYTLPAFFKSNVMPAIESLLIQLEDISSKIDVNLFKNIENFILTFSDSLMGFVTSASTGAVKWFTRTATSIPSFFINIIFVVISSFFITLDFERIMAFLQKQLPPKAITIILAVKENLFGTIFKFIKAYSILMFITFVELSIGFSIMKLDNAVAVAALIACIDIMPVLGTGGVVIPWMIIELVNGNLPLALGLLITYLIVTVIRNILEPKVVGEQIGLYPLVTLICMFVGGSLYGVVGLFGLPIAITILKNLNDNGTIKIFK